MYTTLNTPEDKYVTNGHSVLSMKRVHPASITRDLMKYYIDITTDPTPPLIQSPSSTHMQHIQVCQWVLTIFNKNILYSYMA